MARATKRRSRRGETFMAVLFLLCGLVVIGWVGVIALYLVVSGLPVLVSYGPLRFLFGQVWASTAPDPQLGIFPFLATSVVGTVCALLVGAPVGVLTAIYLSKLARPKLAGVVRPAVELLAGIPSVVYGLMGLLLLCPFLMRVFRWKSGATLLAAVVVLTVMILPTLISVSESALLAVPPEYEEASFALGATQVETIWKVSVPAARSGIVAGLVLGIGRAIGEAMAVLMVAGNVPNLPWFSRPVTFLTTAIAKEMGYATGVQRQALFSIGLVLFGFVVLLNGVLHWVLRGGKHS